MTILGVPAILALFGLFCGYFAVGLGRDPYRWFLLGTIAGPVGLIVLVMPPLQRAGCCQPCQACNQNIRPEDKFCRHCGAQVEGYAEEITTDGNSKDIRRTV